MTAYRFSAGIPRGLIEASRTELTGVVPDRFSAGIPRGLIEATGTPATIADGLCLPRVFPAASLKRADHGDGGRGVLVFRGYSPRPH